MSNRHVVPDGDGGWNVKKPGVDKPTSNHKTQAEAEAQARRDIQQSGGGELITHNRKGQIRSKDTIAPGRESRTKDREH